MKSPRTTHLLQVYADFDFLGAPLHAGNLLHERVGGSALYTYIPDKDFVKAFPSLFLSADIAPGTLSSYAKDNIFRCFGDCLPDRWGKALINKRERIRVGKNGVPRTFDDFGFLVQIDDFTRMGAFRFVADGEIIGRQADAKRNVPIITDIEKLLREARRFEESIENGGDIETEWIYNIWAQGSSLGGARPKANIIDNSGNLCIAKFPSIKDTYDVALWEHFATVLAKKCGLYAADTSLLSIPGTKYHTLLSKRFDRDGERRIHYASAITMTGLVDGDSASSGHGYPDIVDAVIRIGSFKSQETTIREVLRRIIFNICIGNSDDHFRNHGFLLEKDGWRMSPAFDLNPTNDIEQSLLISSRTNKSSLQELLASSEEYFIEQEETEKLIFKIADGFVDWKQVARECGVPQKERERFSARFDWSIRQLEQLGRKAGPQKQTRKRENNLPASKSIIKKTK